MNDDNPKNRTQKKMIRLKAASKKFNISPSHLRLLCRTGVLQAAKVGKDWYLTGNEESIRYILANSPKRGQSRREYPPSTISGIEPMTYCPLCGKLLAQVMMGINAHLRLHIRKGDLAREDEQSLRMKILGPNFKGGKQ